jgi:hypothetical protein
MQDIDQLIKLTADKICEGKSHADIVAGILADCPPDHAQLIYAAGKLLAAERKNEPKR